MHVIHEAGQRFFQVFGVLFQSRSKFYCHVLIHYQAYSWVLFRQHLEVVGIKLKNCRGFECDDRCGTGIKPQERYFPEEIVGRELSQASGEVIIERLADLGSSSSNKKQ